MDDIEKKATLGLFKESGVMAVFIDRISTDDRIPEDIRRQANNILDEIEGK